MPLPFSAFDEKVLMHAAVAFAVQVLDRELEGAQLVQALVGIGAGLRNVEAEGDGVALRLVGEGRGPRR